MEESLMREYGFELKKEFYLEDVNENNIDGDDDEMIEQKQAQLLHHLRAYTFEQDVGPPVMNKKPQASPNVGLFGQPNMN
jgi:hypothetical protein